MQGIAVDGDFLKCHQQIIDNNYYATIHSFDRQHTFIYKFLLKQLLLSNDELVKKYNRWLSKNLHAQ
jgi:hypothetical protein